MSDTPPPPEPALLTLIARELATEQYTLAQILRRYMLEQDFYDREIKPNEFFKRVLADYTKEWQSLGSTKTRLSFAAIAALEEKLPILADRMGNRQSALSDAVNTAKLFKELAGIASPVAGAGAAQGERFTISINFGNHKVALETAKGTQGESPLLIDAERSTDLQPIQQRPPGED